MWTPLSTAHEIYHIESWANENAHLGTQETKLLFRESWQTPNASGLTWLFVYSPVSIGKHLGHINAFEWKFKWSHSKFRHRKFFIGYFCIECHIHVSHVLKQSRQTTNFMMIFMGYVGYNTKLSHRPCIFPRSKQWRVIFAKTSFRQSMAIEKYRL